MVSINSNTKILAIKLMASAFGGVVKILIVKKIVNECQSSSTCNKWASCWIEEIKDYSEFDRLIYKISENSFSWTLDNGLRNKGQQKGLLYTMNIDSYCNTIMNSLCITSNKSWNRSKKHRTLPNIYDEALMWRQSTVKPKELIEWFYTFVVTFPEYSGKRSRTKSLKVCYVFLR